MRSIIAGILIIVVAVMSSCGSRSVPGAGLQYQNMKMSGKVRVGIKENSMPFSKRIGDSYMGFEFDLIIEIVSRMGLEKITFVPVTTQNGLQLLEAGQIDMLAATTTITKTREKSVDFSMPYFEDGQMIMVKAQNSNINDYTDLAGRRVGVLTRSTSAINITSVAPSAGRHFFDDREKAAEALIRGDIDCLTSDGMLLLGLKKRLGDKVKIVGERFSSEPYGIAIRENQSDLRDAINNALQDMWSDGTWHEIYDTWMGPNSTYPSDIDFAMEPFPN